MARLKGKQCIINVYRNQLENLNTKSIDSSVFMCFQMQIVDRQQNVDSFYMRILFAWFMSLFISAKLLLLKMSNISHTNYSPKHTVSEIGT